MIIDAKHKIIPNLVNKKDSANRHFLSFVVKVLTEVLPKTDNSVGIDLGIKTKASCRGALMQPPYTVKKLMQENH